MLLPLTGDRGFLSLARFPCRSFGNSYASEHQPTEKENQEVLQRALDLGCNFIDTADVYGFGISEEQLGKMFTPYANLPCLMEPHCCVLHPAVPNL